jgi:WhiB family redox-sensing transcriptional regulator
MTMLQTPEWMRDAACKDMGADIFYPEKGNRATEAKAVCARCKVCSDCLEYAMQWPTLPYNQGVWGNTTPEERWKLYKRQRGRVSESA